MRDVRGTRHAKCASGALLAVVEDDTPMNELRHVLAAGGYAGTSATTERFVDRMVGRAWATLSTSQWPAGARDGVALEVARLRDRIMTEAAQDPRPADALVLTSTDALEGVLWRHLRKRHRPRSG